MFEISESGPRADDKSRFNISFEAGFSSAKGSFIRFKDSYIKTSTLFCENLFYITFLCIFSLFAVRACFNIP